MWFDRGLLTWFAGYLQNSQQQVVINGEASDFGAVNAGVPPGSVLGPLLFLVYINDLTNVVQDCSIRLFADDTCLFIEVDNRTETSVKVNNDLSRINNWSKDWLVQFSAAKTKSLIISTKKDVHLNPPVYLNNQKIEEVKSFKYLGLHIMSSMRWNMHIDLIVTKAMKRLNAMNA